MECYSTIQARPRSATTSSPRFSRSLLECWCQKLVRPRYPASKQSLAPLYHCTFDRTLHSSKPLPKYFSVASEGKTQSALQKGRLISVEAKAGLESYFSLHGYPMAHYRSAKVGSGAGRYQILRAFASGSPLRGPLLTCATFPGTDNCPPREGNDSTTSRSLQTTADFVIRSLIFQWSRSGRATVPGAQSAGRLGARSDPRLLSSAGHVSDQHGGKRLRKLPSPSLPTLFLNPNPAHLLETHALRSACQILGGFESGVVFTGRP